MDKNTEIIFNKLPEDMRNKLLRLPDQIIRSFEEIRIKTSTDTIVISQGHEYHIDDKDSVTPDKLEEILNRLIDYSYYAYENELSNGYITIEGGHRVGICGRVTLNNGRVHLIKEISSLNIRKSREIIGAADKLIDKILNIETGEISNTLIISPPKCGKTTLIRDISRMLSNQGYRIGICDERSEIAGCYNGIPSYDLGERSDILDGCPKAQGIKMLIRSMSPDVIVTDEIGKPEDIEAIEEALSSGVKIITTIHGKNYEDAVRSAAGELIRNQVFDILIFLSSKPVTGSVSRIMMAESEIKGGLNA